MRRVKVKWSRGLMAPNSVGLQVGLRLGLELNMVGAEGDVAAEECVAHVAVLSPVCISSALFSFTEQSALNVPCCLYCHAFCTCSAVLCVSACDGVV